jgi:hypothetical protein
MTHDCRDFGYAPGAALCAYLVSNTSWEFGQRNAKRAAACIESRSRGRFSRQLDEGKFPAEITGELQGSGNKDMEIMVSFDVQQLSLLTLSAARRAK